MSKVIIQTLNGPLTEDDFDADAPKVGASDKKYSKKDQEELMKLADELKAKKK